MGNSDLYIKINSLPEELKTEINKFVESLLQKRKDNKKKRTPQFGSGKGKIFISPDFDEPLEDFNEYIK